MRILLAGTSSGCGKTTASLLLMAALRERGLDVAPCKVGPDYIDTGFHELVCGRPSHNLDSFLIEPRDLPTLLSRPADITVIEGVMGYYDGMDATSCRQSTWEMARLTRTPVLLVVDASGSAASAAATASWGMSRPYARTSSTVCAKTSAIDAVASMSFTRSGSSAAMEQNP